MIVCSPSLASASGLSQTSPAVSFLPPPALLLHFHHPELRADSASGPRHSLWLLVQCSRCLWVSFLAPMIVLGLRLLLSLHPAPRPALSSLHPLAQPLQGGPFQPFCCPPHPTRQEEDAQTVPTHESQHSGASPLARAPPGAYDRLSQPPQTVGLHGPQLPTKALGIPPNPAHSETISLPTAPLTVAEAPDYLEAVFHLSTGNQTEPGSLCLFCRAVPKATSGQLLPCLVTKPFSRLPSVAAMTALPLCGHHRVHLQQPPLLIHPQHPLPRNPRSPQESLLPLPPTPQFMPHIPCSSLTFTLIMGSQWHPEGLREGDSSETLNRSFGKTYFLGSSPCPTPK
jgi:hypothetical protein